MKKSFKKAGAAVLSMAMLLSMGAVSLPVYALPDHETVVPAQLAVTIATTAGLGEKHADDDNHHYDYLQDVKNANVTVYRVATLGSDGWQWENGIKTALENVTANETTVISDFETLLQKADGSDTIPAASSDELQSLAAKLERILTSGGVTPVTVGNGTVSKEGNGFTTAYIPADADLFEGNTKNKIGYYLISTSTNDAGVVLQPALVVLRNKVTDGTATDTTYVKSVSLKGNAVTIDKSIEDIATYVDADDKKKENDTAATGDKTYVSRSDIAGSKDTGIIDADDIVHYQIAVDVPQYDKKLTGGNGAAQIQDFVITDTPDKGINVIGRVANTGGVDKFADVQNTGASDALRNEKIEVYFSEDAELVISGANADTKLSEYEDYAIAANDVANKGKGFKVSFTLEQLRGKKSDGTLNTNSALYNAAVGSPSDADYVPAYSTSMEGGKIFVVFKAQTTEEFNTVYEELTPLVADATVDGLTWAAIEAKLDGIATMTANDKTTYANNITDAELTAVQGKDGFPTSNAPTDENVKIATYAALKDAQATVDAQNVLIKEANAAKQNGNKNVADVQYENKYNGEGAYKTTTDETKLYSVDLDLTKVALDNKVVYRPYYVSAVNTTDVAGESSILKVDDQPVMLQKDSTYLTTIDISKAGTPIKYVTGIETTDKKDEAVADGTVYLATNEKETTTDVAGAKTYNTAGSEKYADDFEHTPVQGAIFELKEVYSAAVSATGNRIGGNDGKHSRGLAITNLNGKLKMLQAGTAQDTVPPLVTLAAGDDYAVGNIVYYETVEGETTTYIPYTVTANDAWDRLGEGTYELSEVYAPTGYKKWSAPSTFTITALNDGAALSDTTTNFTGEFAGASNSGGFLSGNEKATDSKAATFHFSDTTGALQNEILNEYDDTLPATGGIGTVLFTAGGISVVLIAGALFVMYMKKRNAEDEE